MTEHRSIAEDVRIAANAEVDARASSGQGTAIDLQFDITAAGYTFADPGFTVSAGSTFGPPTNNSTTQCTVEDNNVAEYEYTLHLINSAGSGISLDPRIINR